MTLSVNQPNRQLWSAFVFRLQRFCKKKTKKQLDELHSNNGKSFSDGILL